MNSPAQPDLSGRHILVTGANSGIGKATAKALAFMGARVWVGARNEAKAKEAVEEIRQQSGNPQVHHVLGDFSSLADTERMGHEILEKVPALNVVVHNAGAMFAKREVTADGFERTFAINQLAPFLLHQILEDRLIQNAPSRVVVVASGAHRWGWNLQHDPMSEKRFLGMEAYGRSKLANILFTNALALRLKDKDVTANALHPGVVRTDLGREGERGGLFNFGFSLIAPLVKNADQGARTSVYLASSKTLEGVTGKYFRNSKATNPWRMARNKESAQWLWDYCEQCLEQWRARP